MGKGRRGFVRPVRRHRDSGNRFCCPVLRNDEHHLRQLPPHSQMGTRHRHHDPRCRRYLWWRQDHRQRLRETRALHGGCLCARLHRHPRDQLPVPRRCTDGDPRMRVHCKGRLRRSRRKRHHGRPPVWLCAWPVLERVGLGHRAYRRGLPHRPRTPPARHLSPRPARSGQPS